jgi:hypothetical protein
VKFVRHVFFLIFTKFYNFTGGAGSLYRIQGHLDRYQYVDILETIMKPQVNGMFPGEGFAIIQDNCPIHNAGKVKEWFDENPQFDLWDWPANSPDLNPIEHAWAYVKNRIELDGVDDANALWQRTEDAWDAMLDDVDYWEKLALSMPRRIAAVIQANGYWTKY